MENCVKAILYCYPQLEGIEEGYLQHIRNRAVMSADSREPAQKIAEHLAVAVLEKAKIRRLNQLAVAAMDKLSTEEKMLLNVRYFGKLDRVKRAFAEKYAGIADEKMRPIPYWSERTYFRKQKKLLSKLTERFMRLGLTKEEFVEEYAYLDGIGAIYTYIELGKDLGLEKKERAFLEFLKQIRGE